MTQNRAYSAAHFAFELDGDKSIGIFKSVEGGGVKADVMTYQHGADFARWRQVGKPKFEDVKLQVGLSMSKPFYDWIDGFFQKKVVRKTGAIIAADFHYKERARREFKEALIKEIVFPKLDGQDKSAVYMGVTLAVEDMVFKRGGGQSLADRIGGFDEQKRWTSNNFELVIDGGGLGPALGRVAKIDSFTVKQNILEYHGGGFRAPIKCSSQVEYPQISFYVPEVDAGPIFDRFKQRAVAGKVEKLLTGSITTRDSEGNSLFEIKLEGIDICNVQPDKSDAGSEDIKLVKIDIFTEKMSFKHL